jgi:rubrerythrin
MFRILETIRVKVAIAVGWKIGNRKAEAIRGFQATEADGVWHLHRVMAAINDPEIKAFLFTHSLEEETHAEEFASIYQRYTDHAIPPATYERNDLLSDGDPIWKALAFVHVGEEDATARFGLLTSNLGPEPLRDSLAQIVEDEEGHVDLTEQILLKLGATQAEIRKEYGRVRRRRLWEEWLRSGRRVVNLIAEGLLSIAYFGLAPLVFLSARRALKSKTVAYDNNRVKRLAA